MSEQFKPGEVVEGCNHRYDIELNGMECEIIGGLMPREVFYGDGAPPVTVTAYFVRWADGREWNSEPIYLRRRKPPASDSGERLIATLIRETLDKAPQRVEVPA